MAEEGLFSVGLLKQRPMSRTVSLFLLDLVLLRYFIWTMRPFSYIIYSSGLVVYNASNNELVRTKTLVKNAIVQIDATPFRQWYELNKE